MRKQGRKKRVGRVILFLTGLSILLYPAVSGRWNAWRADRLRSGYQETVRNTDTSETDEMRKAAEAYNRTLYVPSVPDAFSIRDGVKDKTYESLLNPNGDGVMGYLEIPAIDVSLPIGHYTTKETLEKGAGHLFGSSLPVGGEGNSFRDLGAPGASFREAVHGPQSAEEGRSLLSACARRDAGL